MTTVRDGVVCLDCETIYPSTFETCPKCLGKMRFAVGKYIRSLFSNPKEAKYGLSEKERAALRVQNENVSPEGVACGYIVLDRFFPTPEFYRLNRESRKAQIKRNDKPILQAPKTDPFDDLRRKFGEKYRSFLKRRLGFNASNAKGVEENTNGSGNHPQA